MIEQTLRALLPRPLLRRMALSYNSVKIRTLDKLLYASQPFTKEDYIVYREHFALPEMPAIIAGITDPAIREGLSQYTSLKDVEYLLHYTKGCYIEPANGWAFSLEAKLIYPSLGTSHVEYLKKPSLLKFYFKRKHCITLDKAISLRDISERAYYHFYNDTMGKLPYLMENGVDVTNIPIIVAERLFNKPFFKEFLAESRLFRELNWIVQREQYVYCKEAFFCKPVLLYQNSYNYLSEELMPAEPPTQEHKVFLTRDKRRLRYIENMVEIEPVLIRHGFKIIDADQLSLREQVTLFRNARYIIGIHGGGLTNIIYRRGYPLQVTEIFPPGWLVPYHYAVLAARYGCQYDALQGEAGSNKYSGGFKVNPAMLDQQIKKI